VINPLPRKDRKVDAFREWTYISIKFNQYVTVTATIYKNHRRKDTLQVACRNTKKKHKENMPYTPYKEIKKPLKFFMTVVFRNLTSRQQKLVTKALLEYVI
jgi:hypothetical protein